MVQLSVRLLDGFSTTHFAGNFENLELHSVVKGANTVAIYKNKSFLSG